MTSLPAEKVYMETFYEEGQYLNTAQDGIVCGSHGCIAGWATHVPEFQRLGLRPIKIVNPFDRQGLRETYHARLGEFFDIPESITSWLFAGLCLNDARLADQESHRLGEALYNKSKTREGRDRHIARLRLQRVLELDDAGVLPRRGEAA
jgi:hypothetical protein